MQVLLRAQTTSGAAGSWVEEVWSAAIAGGSRCAPNVRGLREAFDQPVVEAGQNATERPFAEQLVPDDYSHSTRQNVAILELAVSADQPLGDLQHDCRDGRDEHDPIATAHGRIELSEPPCR